MRCGERLAAAACVLLLSAPARGNEPLSAVHRLRYAMGTTFEIAAYHPDRADAQRAADRALDEVVRLDAVLSHFRRDSDLSRLVREGRRRTRGAPAAVRRRTCEVRHCATVGRVSSNTSAWRWAVGRLLRNRLHGALGERALPSGPHAGDVYLSSIACLILARLSAGDRRSSSSTSEAVDASASSLIASRKHRE